MSLFSADYFKPKYFQANYFRSNEEESARSGVFRLWLYKFQEESLKKQRAEVKEAIKEQVEKIVAPKKVVAKPKPQKVGEPVVEKAPQTPAKPLYRQTVPTYDSSVVDDAWSLVSSTVADIFHLQPYLDAMRRRQEEEEEDIEMLLLAA